MNKVYLFVYGTLRKHYGLKLIEQMADDLEFVSKAKIKGILYNIGAYPGAVKENTDQEIIGDIYQVIHPSKVFPVLDEYEGYYRHHKKSSEFLRKRSRVRLRSGKTLIAWVYWYNRPPEGKAIIKHKDYLNFLKRCKTD